MCLSWCTALLLGKPNVVGLQVQLRVVDVFAIEPEAEDLVRLGEQLLLAGTQPAFEPAAATVLGVEVRALDLAVRVGVESAPRLGHGASVDKVKGLLKVDEFEPRHVETGLLAGDLAEWLVLPDSIVDDGEPLDAVAEGVRAHPAVPEQGDGAEEQRPGLPAIRQGAYHSLAN